MSHDYLWQPRDPDSTADTTFADAREAIEAVRIGDLYIDRHSPAVLERAKAAAQQLCEAWDAEAERDHLRRALEWAITEMQGRDVYQCPYPCPDGQHGEDGRCLGTLEGCWMIAALAATKEAQS